MKYALFFIAACGLSMHASAEQVQKPNIIFLVGDGMGVSYTSAYRAFSSINAEPTIFDELLVGMASTQPEGHEQVTDSAAAATALSTGFKTYNGAIGINSQHQPLETLLEKAKKLGYSTGIAVTCQINHATPAAFVAHVDSRESYNAIANQYLDNKINGKPKVDLMLGGGQEYFIRKDRNLIKEFEKIGYSYQSEFVNLNKIKQLPAIGMFAKSGMEPALESEYPLRLADMTAKSLELLQANSGQPFFLMLEASQIDWCGHANDIACAMAETNDMAETMKRIKVFIDKNPNTIFVATADHSTGGLSLGVRGEYLWSASVVRNIKATAPTIARRLLNDKSGWRQTWQESTQIKLADDELKNLDSLIIQADETNREIVFGQLTAQVLAIIDKYSSTGWTTKGHTGEDVQVFSYGLRKGQFAGHLDNTEIAKKLISYLE